MWLVETKERLKNVMETMEDLRRENEELKCHNTELSKATLLSHNEQLEGEAQSTGGTNVEELEKKRLHNNLVNKNEEMAKKMWGSSSLEQLLNCMDLHYSAEVMVEPLLPKFKILQIEMYDRSQDPVDHLENFKVHMTFHDFSREIVC